MCTSVNDENRKAVMDPEAHCVQYTSHFMFVGRTGGDIEKWGVPVISSFITQSVQLIFSILIQHHILKLSWQWTCKLIQLADSEFKIQMVLVQAYLVPSVGFTGFIIFISCYPHTHAINISVWMFCHVIALESGQWLLGLSQNRIFRKLSSESSVI